jgi:hypothetical protein
MGNQMRKVQLTINNPSDVGLDHIAIGKILMRFCPRYYCLCDEIATTGTQHTHVFMYSDSPFRFSTVKSRFPTAHIERCYGTAKDNKDYIMKTGKWSESQKSDTSIPGTFEEWGDLPDEREEKSPGMCELIADISAGKSTAQIVMSNPKFGFRVKDIDALRQALRAEKYMAENRAVKVDYLFGKTGSGKTRSIYDQYGAKEICRITHYGTNHTVLFDGYYGQDVLVFEEFSSQIAIGDMLNYLDIYPLMLPARYSDKVACYTRVYITSNLPLDRQYENIQRCSMETWRAFIRRLDSIVEFASDGTISQHCKEEYI